MVRVSDRLTITLTRDEWVEISVKPIGEVEVNGLRFKNYVNYTIATILLNQLMLRGCSQQYPCFQVKKVGLYDTGGNLIKTLPLQGWSTINETNVHWLALRFYDGSSDQYTVGRVVLYGLQTGDTDSESEYYILAKQVLSQAVQKASNASLNMVWRIGLDRTDSLTRYGFWDDYLMYFDNALLNAYQMLQGAYNLEIYNAQQAFVKNLPYAEGPYQDTEPSGYRVDIAFDDLTTDAYMGNGFRLVCSYGGQAIKVAQFWTSGGIGKGSSPLRYWYRIRVYYDFMDTAKGVRSTYPG
ncbi:MAG: hypothetical protein QXG57_06060 [Thermofilaceae archaeon]